jgi:uncharacterized protein YebE (UPF0316 family)
MEYLLTPEAWLGALLIFALRVADMSLDTLRVLTVVRGRKGTAWVLGFFQSAIFVIAITRVLGNLDNPLNFIGYAAGFATGNVVGMQIEEWMAIGYVNVRIVSTRRGAAITERMRSEGFAVTEIPARGKDGMVTLINASVQRRDMERVQKIIDEMDPEAFITAEDVRRVHHGFWRA